MYNPNNTRLQNRIHINCTFEKEGSKITKSCVAINVFEWDQKRAASLYRELLEELGEAPVTVPKTENGQSIQPSTKKIEFFPECPDHHIKMVERVRKADGISFYGCPLYRNGCRKTAQYLINQEIANKSSFER
jgi:hypothetical protein